MRFDTTGGLSNAVVIRAALAAVCLLAAGSAPAQSVPFATGTVEYRTLADERLFDGRVEAVNRSTISAQTSGEIIELPFDVNDFVPKGALIVRIDDTRQKAELDKAIADEAKARALFPTVVEKDWDIKSEAQAAARLQHTNIVPVFSVGCERGVHYYAMQYIEGETLARRRHQPCTDDFHTAPGQ